MSFTLIGALVDSRDRCDFMLELASAFVAELAIDEESELDSVEV